MLFSFGGGRNGHINLVSSSAAAVVVVVVVFLVGDCDGTIFNRKTHVRISNGLEGDPSIPALNVHCKSKDDDLGEHAIVPPQYFEFKFVPNLWGNTLFFCRFWWAGSKAFWFDIYVEQRDYPRCPEKCWWEVHPDGPCFLNSKTGKYTRCQKWNKEEKPALLPAAAGNSTAINVTMTDPKPK